MLYTNWERKANFGRWIGRIFQSIACTDGSRFLANFRVENNL